VLVSAVRVACTSGGVTVLSGDGTRQRIPAGLCWIQARNSLDGSSVIGWNDRGRECSATISRRDLTGYLSGCMLQYR